MNRLCGLAFAGALLALGPAAAQTRQAGTTWVNELGSVLTIESFNPDNSITGTYVNNASGFGCQGTPYPINGWANSYAIGFSVLWTNASEDCNSLTSWTGYYDAASNTLVTHWNLVFMGQDGPLVQPGQDTFTPQ